MGRYRYPRNGFEPFSLPKSSYSPKRKKYYRNYRRNNIENLPPEAQIFLVIAVFLVMFWMLVVNPAILYIKEHIFFFGALGVLIFAGLIVGLIFYAKARARKKKEKESFEKEQINLGLIKFVDRFTNERWGKPDEVQKWTEEDEEAREKEKLINRIIDEINNFHPIRAHHNEFSYQLELFGYLKAKFPNADIEQQKGSSRPDIVVGDVAIKLKGPTRTEELQTIADKCMRYYQHFGELIIVLFEVNVYEPRYQEWVNGIKNTFPRVRIIRK